MKIVSIPFLLKGKRMSKQNIIDYVLEHTGVHSQQRLNQRNKRNWKKEFNLSFCPCCNKAYEYIKNTSTGRGRKLLKHDEFPKFGLERKVCSGCNTDIVL
jgi:hypothetical protein